VDEQVQQRRQRIGAQHVPDETLQAELLPELHQQQVRRGVGHEIGRRQPGRLVGIEAERALREVEIDRHQRIAQACGHANQHADREITHAPPRG
jgi:hypothetical protein